MISLLNIEQSEGSEVVNFLLSNGKTVDVKQSDIERFIEENDLNVDCEYGGNSGSGEPWNDLPEVDVITDPAVYLENNLDKVCHLYFIDKVTPQLKSETMTALEKRLSELDDEDALAIKNGDLDKSFRLSSIKCELMDLRVVLGQELGLIRRAV